MYQDLKLSDRARVIEMAVRSGITDLDTIEEVYNTFAEGGDLEEPAERRKVGDHYLTLEQYKELQRDTIRQAAVQKALTRTRGVAPIIDGKPALSCIYTFTDNYGRKYQVAGTQTFAANPEKYGFEVAGPVTKGMEGNMYLQLNESGVPYHATMITGYTDKGEPLLTYSSGHAGVDLTGVPLSREDWDRNQRAVESLQRIAGPTPERETYEHYVERFNRSHSPEADYHKNTRAWHSPQYETYRFIGTPDDNAAWTNEWMQYQAVPALIEVPKPLNNQIVFDNGGEKPSYNGEIRQGKKWNFIDHYLADNPKIAHGLRKTGVLIGDAARVLFGRTYKGVEMDPGKMSDYGDIINNKLHDNNSDSFVDRMSEAGNPLGAFARAARPLINDMAKEFPNWEWSPRIKRLNDSLIKTDRLINMGQFIDDFATPVEQFGQGGTIHIKKKNRGKFTALKKRTGHSASWFKAHGTPAQKKMAVFALNAKKWKHGDGGYLMTKL